MQTRIRTLEPRLANQIAAGEVVERPASIVKELLENSIDAGATRIKIDIEKGGMSRIAIRDNGIGIIKEDLALALSRHATSKITNSDDLMQIKTLGFRGEALASICAVSHLVLQSCAAGEDQAWQVIAEGADMQPQLSPTSHPQGTTVEVRDLFFNLPARRKFLRSEKTEFLHIEEIVKKVALSKPNVAIILNHNGRKIVNIPGCDPKQDLDKRVRAIFGKSFMDHALHVEFSATDLTLTGYISAPAYTRSQTDQQYFFLNGRVIRDKVINHALRQAYDNILHPGRYPCYVLYLMINPSSVDVNVHPTKHEVRFRESHLVHDFILYHLASVLNNQKLPDIPVQTEHKPIIIAEANSDYNIKDKSGEWCPVKILEVVDNRFVIYSYQDQICIFDFFRELKRSTITINANEITKELIFPIRFNMEISNQPVVNWLEQLGFQFFDLKEGLLLARMPELYHCLEEAAIKNVIKKLLENTRIDSLMMLKNELIDTIIKNRITFNCFEHFEYILKHASIYHLTSDRLDALLEETV